MESSNIVIPVRYSQKNPSVKTISDIVDTCLRKEFAEKFKSFCDSRPSLGRFYDKEHVSYHRNGRTEAEVTYKESKFSLEKVLSKINLDVGTLPNYLKEFIDIKPKEDYATILREGHTDFYAKLLATRELSGPLKRLGRFVARLESNEKLKKNMQGKILDFGCNVGCRTGALQDFNYDSFGVDIDKTAVHIGKFFGVKNLYTAPNPETGRYALPFKSDNFDLVISNLVLNGVPTLLYGSKNFDLAIGEISRVIKPGGILSISSPHPHKVEGFEGLSKGVYLSEK